MDHLKYSMISHEVILVIIQGYGTHIEELDNYKHDQRDHPEMT